MNVLLVKKVDHPSRQILRIILRTWLVKKGAKFPLNIQKIVRMRNQFLSVSVVG